MKLLEVHLSPLDEQRFRAIATHSPAGDGSADSSLPFWKGEQDWRSTLIKVLEGTGVFRSEHFPKPSEQEWMVEAGILASGQQSFHPSYLRQIGQALYAALFPPNSSLKSVFQTALRLAEREDTELHVRLKFSADSAERSRLADYPWELLHDGQRFLQHRQVVISRYIAYEALPPALPSQDRLRVLLISPRAEDAAQGLAKLSDVEQQAIRMGLSKAESEGSIVLESLSKATLKALRVDLSQRTETQMPQVLHFDGHGLFGKRCINPQCGQIHAGIMVERCQNCGQLLPEPTGFLLFEDEQGRPDFVSATSLAACLQKGVALVVLSACQSGMAVAGESMFNGTAQQLIDARVPAVVAMQYVVRVDAASQFAEQFYRVLGQKKPLVTALNEGRKWMGVDGNQWYRPVLYLRWLDNQGGQLFANIAEGLPVRTVLDFEIKQGFPNPSDKPSVELVTSVLPKAMDLPPLPLNSIFISYRRSDSNDVTGRIYDRLSSHFSRDVVFKDVDSIPFGVDFRTHLNQGVGNCRVLVAVIGSTWLHVSGADGKRRLDNPDDWVRAEIETALGRGIPVIPLLAGGARLPRVDDLPESLKQLTYQSAAQARSDPDFHQDLDRLIRRLEEVVGSPESSVNVVSPPISTPKDGVGVQSPDQLERRRLEKEYAKLTAKYELLNEQIEGELNEDNKDTLCTRRETIKQKMNEIWSRLHG